MWGAHAQVVSSHFLCIRVWFLLLCSAMGKAAKKKSKAERELGWKPVEWTDSEESSEEEEPPDRDPSTVASAWSSWEATASTAASGAWTLEDAGDLAKRRDMRIEKFSITQYNLYCARKGDWNIDVMRRRLRKHPYCRQATMRYNDSKKAPPPNNPNLDPEMAHESQYNLRFMTMEGNRFHMGYTRHNDAGDQTHLIVLRYGPEYATTAAPV